MLGPRNTCSTKERFPKVSSPRHELITLNFYSLDSPRQINNALPTVLIFKHCFKLNSYNDQSFRQEYRKWILFVLAMHVLQPGKVLRFEMSCWRNPACLGTHILLRSSVSDPVSGPMTKPAHLADHGVITAGEISKWAKKPDFWLQASLFLQLVMNASSHKSRLRQKSLHELIRHSLAARQSR